MMLVGYGISSPDEEKARARAQEAAERYDEAIKQYETFLHIWRDADDGIKMIEDAKERLASLRNKL